MPARANTHDSPLDTPTPSLLKFSRAAASSETKSVSRRAPQSCPSASGKAKQSLPPALRCTPPPQTAHSRPTPPASSPALPAFPARSKNSRNPYPYSPRSSIRPAASPASDSETPPPQLVRPSQTAKAPPQFLPLCVQVSSVE